jgi:hypothetical protein
MGALDVLSCRDIHKTAYVEHNLERIDLFELWFLELDVEHRVFLLTILIPIDSLTNVFCYREKRKKIPSGFTGQRGILYFSSMYR